MKENNKTHFDQDKDQKTQGQQQSNPQQANPLNHNPLINPAPVISQVSPPPVMINASAENQQNEWEEEEEEYEEDVKMFEYSSEGEEEADPYGRDQNRNLPFAATLENDIPRRSQDQPQFFTKVPKKRVGISYEDYDLSEEEVPVLKKLKEESEHKEEKPISNNNNDDPKPHFPFIFEEKSQYENWERTPFPSLPVEDPDLERAIQLSLQPPPRKRFDMEGNAIGGESEDESESNVHFVEKVQGSRHRNETQHPDRQSIAKEMGQGFKNPKGQIGLVSWNVAHFSEHDFNMDTRVFSFLERLDAGIWKKSFAVIGSALENFIFPDIPKGRNDSIFFEKFKEFIENLKNWVGKNEEVLSELLKIRNNWNFETNRTQHHPWENLKDEKNEKLHSRADLVDEIQELWGLLKLVRQDAGLKKKLKSLKSKLSEPRESMEDENSKEEQSEVIPSPQKDSKVKKEKGADRGKDQAKILQLIGAVEGVLHASVPEKISAWESLHDLFPSMSLLENLRQSLHAEFILDYSKQFVEEGWVDAVGLQEVNNPELLQPQDTDNYDLHTGPKMLGIGNKSEEDPSKQGSQSEYYPLLLSKDSAYKHLETFAVGTNGKDVTPREGESIKWNKGSKGFRPIVVHKLVHKEDPKDEIWYGMVHTTPESDKSGMAEFNRTQIFKQIETALTQLKLAAAASNVPLVIGGDFYLTAEALAKKPDQKSRSRVLKKENQQEFHSTKSEIRKLNQSEENEGFTEEAVKDAQIKKNVMAITVEKVLTKMGYDLAQTVSGTNSKSKSEYKWVEMQIADFFIHNREWAQMRSGILNPKGGMVDLDDPNLLFSIFWSHFSDHLPVGALLAKDEIQYGEDALFPTEPDMNNEEIEKRNLVNLARKWEFNQHPALLEQNNPEELQSLEWDLNQATPKENLTPALNYLKGYEQYVSLLLQSLADLQGDFPKTPMVSDRLIDATKLRQLQILTAKKEAFPTHFDSKSAPDKRLLQELVGQLRVNIDQLLKLCEQTIEYLRTHKLIKGVNAKTQNHVLAYDLLGILEQIRSRVGLSWLEKADFAEEKHYL